MTAPGSHKPHPIRAYRERAGVPLRIVASRAGITVAGLSRIETLDTELPKIGVIARLVLATDGEVSALDIFKHHFAAATGVCVSAGEP